MDQQRIIEFYKKYFIEFYLDLPAQVQLKYDHVFVVIKQADKIPIKFFKKLTGTKNLYEIRVESNSNIYRTFCSLEPDRIVVLFNSFQKKSNKTPKSEVKKALEIQKEYHAKREK